MADNTDEKHLDNPTNAQTEKSADESIYTSDTDTTNSIQETENMEVHHHPDLHHKSKPWKEYLLEGLMIFIAVTLGFFAEQLREHYVEINTEKKYVESLYNDLKTDLLTIQLRIEEKKWLESKFDSVETMLASNDISSNNEFIYYVEKYLEFNEVFTSQDVTYQQLKSSGGFRFLKNIELYKKVSDYYNLYARYQEIDGKVGMREGINETMALESKIFNAKDLASLGNEKNSKNIYEFALRPEGKKFESIKGNKENLNLLYLKIDNTNARVKVSNVFLGWLQIKAMELINELKNEYHLE
jgi:hypothetical protein